MRYLYFISQIFIVTGLLFQASTYFLENRRKKLYFVIAGNFFANICYLILGGYVALISNSIAIIRDSIQLYLDSRRHGIITRETDRVDSKLLLLWLGINTIASAFVFHGILSLLPYFSSSIFTFAILQKNDFIYRISGVLTNTILIIYNIYLINIMGVVLHSVLLIATIFGVIKYIYIKKLYTN